MSLVEKYLKHARLYGAELVFETALGFGQSRPEMDKRELRQLAAGLRGLYKNFDPKKPDELVLLASPEVRDVYFERLGRVFDDGKVENGH